ncbi:MAG: YihY/virulence factor BrkB family protein [Vicinamibacterales bacterium]
MWTTQERLTLHLRLLIRAGRRAIVDLYNSDVLTHSASIAYYALLSLFPFFLLLLSILGSITSDPEEREQVVRFVFRYFPRQFEFITGQLDTFQTSSVPLGVGGLLALIWGALGVFTAITSAVNHAWRVETERSFLKHRFVSFVMLLSAGGVLLIGLALASVVRIAQTRWFGGVVEASPWLQWSSGVPADYAATAFLVVCVALVFYFIPNAPVRFRDVWPGAILVGVLWRVVLAWFSWYVRDLGSWNVVHGSIAAVVVFLVWVYVSAVILLYGVQLTANYSRLQDAASRHPDLDRLLGRISDSW